MTGPAHDLPFRSGHLPSHAAAARRAPDRLHVHDSDGELRVVGRLPDWDDFLRAGVDDVIAATLGSPMVLLRLRKLLQDLRNQAPPDPHDLLDRRLTWVEGELAARFPPIFTQDG